MAKKKPNPQNGRSRAVSKNRPKTASPATGTIFQLKVTLGNTRPAIWRRVQTKDCTLAKLHEVIQASMGWTDSHLHVFDIDGDQFGLVEQWDGDPEVIDSRKLTLGELMDEGMKKFHYVYDMGDTWDHVVLVEKSLAVEPGVKYPRCIAGERACPPEDCGGPWGYGDFLDAVRDPKHERHEEVTEWIGDDFDPEEFDLDAVNKELKGVR